MPKKNSSSEKKSDPNHEVIETFVESINQSVVVIDTNQEIIVWNSQIASQFASKREAIGQPLKKFFPVFWEEFRGTIWGNVIANNIIEKGEIHEFSRYPLKTKLNKIRYFDLQASPFRKTRRKILGCIVIMTDVTDKIYLENQLIRNARTTSLANLGASIAHEIRNPLNSISLNIQLIKEDIETYEPHKETLEIVDSVLYEINRLNKIIKNFLSFSRPPQPTFVSSDLNKVIHRVLSLLKEQARQSEVEIKTDLGKLPLIEIDSDQISQAIYNIVLNAIQAMQEEGGELEVSTLHIEDYIRLEIKDNGPSIQVNDTSSLFDLFFSTKEDGTGLGLPIANRIIEEHQGRIVAENNLGAGACFTIYMPVVKNK